MPSPAIRLLASTNNARGDLFTRLVKDLFFALGYDELRLDVQKSGRELDVLGTHRHEPRTVVAECKAHAKRMGGDALNKFFGALSRERKKHPATPVAGYFVSLGGFTETGIQQELETGDERVILLDAHQVIAELERTHVLVGSIQAVERAGHCAEHAGLTDAVLDGAVLFGHERGYVWAVFYSLGKKRTHFALIHADGTALAQSVANEVIDADRRNRGSLHRLSYLAPPRPARDRAAVADAAVARYRQWLAEECGHIQLDGLPADTDLSVARLKLERLFVPLKTIAGHSQPEQEDADPGLSKTSSSGSPPQSKVQSVGRTLSTFPHLALLADPGGGKSTLLKRLAIAYTFADRRAEVDDELPAREWLPLFLRCRELRDRAHRPILELLDDIPRHAGMSGDETSSFQESVHEALRAGQVLILVDGLDEISDEGARQTFAQHLRTFLAMFPQVGLVITSREAGFRLVAGVIASACVQARLAPFDENDVLRLCESWHVEVVGDTERVRSEARELAGTIWANKRIRTLAENPLLLTTLLVVKRWIGELPRSRAALYREAIRVLIRTWNVEGYTALDEEETLAQLSYVACAMMEQGVHRIGHKALLKLLQSARQELEAELQFAQVSAEKFIERIEYRSSLLMQTGHEAIDRELEAVYEFRHLTFQEYLAARGYVEEQYPGRGEGRSLVDLLEPHFKDERWREVVPLSAVLAGRKAEQIIRNLTQICQGLSFEHPRLSSVYEPHVGLLSQCLLDEVQVTSPTLRAGLLQVARHASGNVPNRGSSLVNVQRGKFGMLFQQVTEEAYFGGGDDWIEYFQALQGFAEESISRGQVTLMSEPVGESLSRALATGDRPAKVNAALTCMLLAFSGENHRSPEERVRLANWFQPLRDDIFTMLDPEDPPLSVAACFALAWIGARRLFTTPLEPTLLLDLYRLWKGATSKYLAWYAAWAFSTQPILPRDSFEDEVWGDHDTSLYQATDGIPNPGHAANSLSIAPLIVGWYRRTPWDDTELASHFLEVYIASEPFKATILEILEHLGSAGRLALEKLQK